MMGVVVASDGNALEKSFEETEALVSVLDKAVDADSGESQELVLLQYDPASVAKVKGNDAHAPESPESDGAPEGDGVSDADNAAASAIAALGAPTDSKQVADKDENDEMTAKGIFNGQITIDVPKAFKTTMKKAHEQMGTPVPPHTDALGKKDETAKMAEDATKDGLKSAKNVKKFMDGITKGTPNWSKRGSTRDAQGPTETSPSVAQILLEKDSEDPEKESIAEAEKQVRASGHWFKPDGTMKKKENQGWFRPTVMISKATAASNSTPGFSVKKVKKHTIKDINTQLLQKFKQKLRAKRVVMKDAYEKQDIAAVAKLNRIDMKHDNEVVKRDLVPDGFKVYREVEKPSEFECRKACEADNDCGGVKFRASTILVDKYSTGVCQMYASPVSKSSVVQKEMDAYEENSGLPTDKRKKVAAARKEEEERKWKVMLTRKTEGISILPGEKSLSSCDASQAPAHGGVGDCTRELSHGATCQPRCEHGYQVTGASRCQSGKLFAAICAPIASLSSKFDRHATEALRNLIFEGLTGAGGQGNINAAGEVKPGDGPDALPGDATTAGGTGDIQGDAHLPAGTVPSQDVPVPVPVPVPVTEATAQVDLVRIPKNETKDEGDSDSKYTVASDLVVLSKRPAYLKVYKRQTFDRKKECEQSCRVDESCAGFQYVDAELSGCLLLAQPKESLYEKMFKGDFEGKATKSGKKLGLVAGGVETTVPFETPCMDQAKVSACMIAAMGGTAGAGQMPYRKVLVSKPEAGFDRGKLIKEVTVRMFRKKAVAGVDIAGQVGMPFLSQQEGLEACKVRTCSDIDAMIVPTGFTNSDGKVDAYHVASPLAVDLRLRKKMTPKYCYASVCTVRGKAESKPIHNCDKCDGKAVAGDHEDNTVASQCPCIRYQVSKECFVHSSSANKFPKDPDGQAAIMADDGIKTECALL